MAISASLLTSSSSGTDATSYTTASVSPAANTLILLCVWSQAAGGVTTSIDSVSGGGMSNWVEVGNNPQTEAGFPERLTVYRAMSASPGSGTLTINYGADTMAIAGWSIVQFSDVKTTGSDGADAVLQAKFGASNPSVTNPSITLDSATTAGNATFATIGNSSGTKTITQGGSFTEVSDVLNNTGGALALQTEFSASNVNTANWTLSAGGDCSIYAVLELALVVASSPPDMDPDYSHFPKAKLRRRV